MNKSLFWKDECSLDRRLELVAQLLYTGDPNARIPNDEGLRHGCERDFYNVAHGFSSIRDLEARLSEIQVKSLYDKDLARIEAPQVSPSTDVFENVSLEKKLSKPDIETPVVQAPIVEIPSVPPTSDVPSGVALRASRRPIPALHPEDRVSALARSILAWFGRESQALEHAGMPDDVVDPARMREVVFELFAKELGTNAFQESVDADPKARAHVEAANRLERAIATSVRLGEQVRDTLIKRLEAFRTAYQDRISEMSRARSKELEEGLDTVVAMQEHDGDQLAVRVLAARDRRIANDLIALRERIEHAALQRGGVKTVAAIDAAFQDAWREAWNGPVTPINIGRLEESLPCLRLLEGNTHSGVARLVTQARASIQEEIDRRLPMVERQMKRAA